jgi:hypothetical protein
MLQAVRFVVINSPGESQDHAADSTGTPLIEKVLGLHYTRFRPIAPCNDSVFLLQNSKIRRPVEKVGLR